MAHLNALVGEMTYDNLICDLNPPVKVGGGVLLKATGEGTVYKRGTVLAKDKDGKLVPLAAGAQEAPLTADCILCDDTAVAADADMNVPVYVAGCFNAAKLIVADGYTMTTADKDKLRERGIYLGGMTE